MLIEDDRWLQSRRRARARRAAESTARMRGRLRRRGGTALLAAMTLAAGGAAAHDVRKPARGAKAERPAGDTRLLQMGSRGPAVRALQRRLRLAADGVFGTATRRAVKRFQRRHGLVADGVVGPSTLAALGPSAAPVARRPVLERIAQCESGGDPKAISPNGRYRGKYQFTRATWRALGGKGDPAKAPEAEQDRRAARLLARAGTSPWPSCA